MVGSDFGWQAKPVGRFAPVWFGFDARAERDRGYPGAAAVAPSDCDGARRPRRREAARTEFAAACSGAGSRASTPATAPSGAPTRDNPPPPQSLSESRLGAPRSGPAAAGEPAPAAIRAEARSTAVRHTSDDSRSGHRIRPRSASFRTGTLADTENKFSANNPFESFVSFGNPFP